MPIWAPQRREVIRRPCICQLLCNGIIERERPSWGKIIDEGIIAQIMINITPVNIFAPRLNMYNEFLILDYIQYYLQINRDVNKIF